MNKLKILSVACFSLLTTISFSQQHAIPALLRRSGYAKAQQSGFASKLSAN
jgi:hypothetical protein